MGIDPQLLRQLHETFRGELEDQLRAITDGLLALEASAGDATQRVQILNTVFRAAHNIKGAARSVDLRDISEIAHHLESLFSVLRSRHAKPDPEAVDVSLEALDRMRDAMAAHQQEQPLAFEPAVLFSRLQTATSRLQAGACPPENDKCGDAAAAVTPAASAAPPAPDGDQDAEREGDRGGARDVSPPPAAGVAHAKASSAAKGEHIRVATEKLGRVAALAEDLQVAKIGLDDRLAKFQGLDAKLRDLASIWRRARPQLRGRLGADLPAAIRELLDSTEEIVIDVEERAAALSKGMRSGTSRIGVISGALQGEIRLLRLVPVATLLRPMARSVREIAREQGKRVELRIAGDQVEMDRLVLDGVRDPLLHLLRNAIDHGLEAPQERCRAGKPDTGVLSLDVESEGGHVVIKVADDGCGIDPAAVRRTAEHRQLGSRNELDRLSDVDVLDFLFQPGFSTRETVTDISGRGIGLDVVRSSVQALKGSVALQTRLGLGTTFVLRLPFTLSTERGLQIRVAQESLIIPSVAVERIVDIAAAAVQHAQGETVVVFGERAVALRDLARLLGFEPAALEERQRLSLVIVSRAGARVAFVVDEVVGEREIVIKRLLPPLETVKNVIGATLTGDGSAMLVLDPAQLMAAALRSASLPAPTAVAVEDRRQPRILVVDDSITTRTLERNILEGYGYDVTVATDGQEAWDTVQRGRFDLVVTDIEMPRMNGYALTQRIKGSDALADLPVIIVSSLAMEEERRRGMEVGADAYLSKGQFETSALLDIVAQLV